MKQYLLKFFFAAILVSATGSFMATVYAQEDESDIEYEDAYQTTDFAYVEPQELNVFFDNYFNDLEAFYAGDGEAALNYPYPNNALYQLLVDNRESGYYEGYQVLNWQIVEETFLNNNMDVNVVIEREVTTPNFPGPTNSRERVNYDLHLQGNGEWKIERYFILSNDDNTLGDMSDFFDTYYANQRDYYSGGSDAVLNQLVTGSDLYNLVVNNRNSGGFYNYEITAWRFIDVMHERDSDEALVLMERDFVNPSSQTRRSGTEVVTYTVTGMQGNMQLQDYEILEYNQNELQLLNNYFESYFEAQRAYYAGESDDVLNFPEQGNDLYNLLVSNRQSGYFDNYQVMDWKIGKLDYHNEGYDIKVVIDRFVDNPAQNLQEMETIIYELQHSGDTEYNITYYDRHLIPFDQYIQVDNFFTAYFQAQQDFYAGLNEEVFNFMYEGNYLYQLLLDNKARGDYDDYFVPHWRIVELDYTNNNQDIRVVIERFFYNPSSPYQSEGYESVTYELHDGPNGLIIDQHYNN